MSPLRKIKVKSIQNNIVVKKPGSWKGWFSLILFFVLLAVIFIGGPASSRFYTASYKKKVDKNGIILKTVIYQKSEHKKSVYFKYFYQGTQYEEYDADRDLYDNLACGDSVEIKIDTLNPDNAYIIKD
jgi:hypothetical protein